MLVFLEIEGVLHRPGRDAPDSLDGQLIANFEAVLRRYRKLEIVLSSSWRLRLPHAELMGWFHADVRSRFVGRTAPGELGSATRGAQIALYLERHGAGRNWTILDSSPAEFAESEAALYCCEPSHGLDLAAAEAWSRHIVERALAALSRSRQLLPVR